MKLGLCLSGGGARGVAHLGVLKALQELNVKIDVISGVSSGAIAGGFVAAGFSPDEVLRLILDLSVTRLLKPALNRGILKHDAMRTIFEEHLGGVKIEDLPTKLIISALNLVEGTTVYFTQGLLSEALVASSSVPIVFKPLDLDNKLMVDGGLINNLPVECLQGECDKIIGVHVNPIDYHAQINNIRQLMERVFLLAINENVRPRTSLCNLYLEPPKLKDTHVYALSQAKEFFEIGYEYTLEHSLEILQLPK